jgi:beta-fructofuranosidase
MQCIGNPDSCEWGNMSWGHMTSTDLLNWTRKRDPALRPDHSYDADGVFTGCFAPPTIPDDRLLAVVYSSVRKLPFHWSMPSYPRNAAGLALAVSRNGGKTWEKPKCNPILPGEPDGVEVSGFRDPYMARWPAADRHRGGNEAMVYGLVSGGIRGSGPTAFLYEIPPSDLANWKYLAPLVDLPLRFQPSRKWSGNYGTNWECVNFLTLQRGSVSKHFLMIGAEGDIERDNIKNYDLPACLSPRTVRAQLWMSGNIINKEGHIKFEYCQGGYLDHGSYYAGNSFQDPRSGRYILYGWVPEEDITLDQARKKGWNGSLALPREIFLLTIPGVVHALKSPLSGIACVEPESQADGSYDLHTLGVKPISEVDHFRRTCGKLHQIRSQILLPGLATEQRRWLYSTTWSTWELEATVSLGSHCETVGFLIRHNHDLSISTTITFSALAESITVDRVSSNGANNVNKCSESGPFTLFTTKQLSGDEGDGVGLKQEPLHIRVFSDGDVLEVYANDRFALATMVYSQSQTGDHGNITAFATGKTCTAIFDDISIWDGLNDQMSIVIDEFDGLS